MWEGRCESDVWKSMEALCGYSDTQEDDSPFPENFSRNSAMLTLIYLMLSQTSWPSPVNKGNTQGISTQSMLQNILVTRDHIYCYLHICMHLLITTSV